MTIDIYTFGLISLSVCTDESDEDLVVSVNEMHPTGITSKWAISKDPKFRTGESNPCPCEQDPSRRHVLMVC